MTPFTVFESSGLWFLLPQQGRGEQGAGWSGLSRHMLWGASESLGWLGGARGGGVPAPRTTLCLLSAPQLHPSCFSQHSSCHLTFLSEFLFPGPAEGLQWKTCVLFLARHCRVTQKGHLCSPGLGFPTPKPLPTFCSQEWSSSLTEWMESTDQACEGYRIPLW